MHVLLIAGGPSAEASVSRASAAEVATALRAAGHSTTVCELDPRLLTRLDGFDVVFPLAHGSLGEDGCLQGLLEILEMPYVGADVRASAIASHKPTAKALFRAAGLPIAKERFVTRSGQVAAGLKSEARSILLELGTQVVIKPAAGGSALGVERLLDASVETISEALERVLAVDDALVESFLSGEEVTCGVLETPDAKALPPTLIHSKAAAWYDFRSKYQPGGSLHQCPAPLAEDTFRQVQDLALAAHAVVGARDLSRSDFILVEGTPTILEVNTLPGMTSTSLFPEAAAAAGLAFPQLCDLLVQAALKRPKPVRAAAPKMPTGETVPPIAPQLHTLADPAASQANSKP